MMKLYPYWPWIVGIIGMIVWFAIWEVIGARQNSSTVMLTTALRDFTKAAPIWPWIAGLGALLLTYHLFYPLRVGS